jgi:2-amino-4-hydroxy-6-hydroxymethyldihydropteridine diphosphokinase
VSEESGPPGAEHPVFAAPVRLAFIALGSNIGERFEHLQAAAHGLAALPATTIVGCSSIFETAPMGAAKFDFLNAVVALHTVVAPLPMLDVLLQIERSRGRARDEKWGPRTLDLDLLAMYDEKGPLAMEHPRLTLPHPGIGHRDFVLRPLMEISPSLKVAGHRLDHHLATLPEDARTVRARHERPLLEAGPFGVSVPLLEGG